MLYIRKNTTLNTTVFDIRNFSNAEKHEILKGVIKTSVDSFSSLSTQEDLTRLVFPCVFSNANLFSTSLGATVRKLFYNDLFSLGRGVNMRPGKETSSIINLNKLKNSPSFLYSYESRSGSRIRAIRDTTQETESYNLTIVEPKAAELIKTRFPHVHKTIENMGLLESRSENRDYNGDVEYCECPECQEMLLKSSTKTRGKALLNDYDTLMVIETVYGLSETSVLGAQLRSLYRIMTNNSSMFSHLTEINGFRQLNDFREETFARKLLTKYKGNNSVTESQYLENAQGFDEHYYNNTSVNSLFDEHETEIILPDHLNRFIPVTFIFLLQNGKDFFQDIQEIRQETVKTNRPRFFTTATVNEYLGYPKYYSLITKNYKEVGYKAQLEDSSILTDYEGQPLINKLTYIPQSFSERLLKSKLKSIAEPQYVSLSQEVFNYPDLFPEFNESFHLYDIAHEKEIRILSKTVGLQEYFSIKFDGRINLSYYTTYISDVLHNRFASYYRNSQGIEAMDLLVHPKMIYSDYGLNLTQLFQYLELRHTKYNKAFNSVEYSPLNLDMCRYEKAVATLLQLLIKLDVPIVQQRNRDTPALTQNIIASEIRKNNGRLNKTYYGHINSSIYRLAFLCPPSRYFLLESIYTDLHNLSTAEFIQKYEELPKEIRNLAVLNIRGLSSSLRIQSKVRKIVKDNILDSNNISRDVMEMFESFSYKFQKKVLTYPYGIEDNTYKVLYTLAGVLTFNYNNEIQTLLSNATLLFRLSDVRDLESSDLKKNGIYLYLTDLYTHTLIFDRLSMYSVNPNQIEYLKTLLKTNETTKELTTLEDFCDKIVRDTTEKYLRSIKVEK